MSQKHITLGEIEVGISKLRQMNALEDAEAKCIFHINIFESVLGLDAPETLALLHRLGDILHERKNLTEALDVTRMAINGRERRLGISHVDTLKSVANLGNILWDLGQHTESEAALRRSYEGFSHTLGPDHYYTLKSMKNLVLFLKPKGRIEECLSIFEIDLMRRISLQEGPAPLHTTIVDLSCE